jgi:hypothetical protein
MYIDNLVCLASLTYSTVLYCIVYNCSQSTVLVGTTKNKIILNCVFPKFYERSLHRFVYTVEGSVSDPDNFCLDLDPALENVRTLA